jgi:hypothetical protein
MLNTENRTITKRLGARPRMTVRETGDGESWGREATMWTADIVRLFGPEPTQDCTRDVFACASDRGLRRSRYCDACSIRDEWETNVLNLVASETGWMLSSFARGPGYAFAGTPSVYSPRKHPNVLRVSWSGGLDI